MHLADLSQNLHDAMPMEVDPTDEGTQQVAEVNDYGLEIDFAELEEEETEVCRSLRKGISMSNVETG